jgi:hypothetical protein
MPIRERATRQKVIQTLDPVVIAADTNCTGVDGAGFGAVTHLLNVGESGDTLSGSVYVTVTLQESDDDSTYTDVAEADALCYRGNTEAANGIVIDAAAEDDAVLKFGYVGSSRYSRLEIDVTGTHSNGTPMASTAILEEPEFAPVSD